MLKLSAGISKKVSDNNFGSRGASVNLEIELESSLIQETDHLQDRIRQLYLLAEQAVTEELGRPDTDAPASRSQHEPIMKTATSGNGNGHCGAGSGHGASDYGKRAVMLSISAGTGHPCPEPAYGFT